MNHHSRIPEQQGIGQTLPPVPVGIDLLYTNPLPSGAMPSGTRLQVGKYQVIIHNFFAEGGFAHVYLARIEGKQGYVVLKRIAVPDAERLATVEKEIAFMRRLGDHKYITRYYESRIDPLPIGGYEALILMEYCPGGGVIDLMNRRLQNRLTEPEILNIFSCVCQAVAYMHYCQPAVLHRDLKVENILILGQDHYKLCDFGSAALSQGSHIPSSMQEIQQIQDDIQRHTTLQYRAPEMIDLYQKKPINEKADIWALGVLLYKLCYYTTPFEQLGELAILNARYSIPNSPMFSVGLRQLITAMLREDQNDRPNIYQVVKQVAELMRIECPIRDIYGTGQPSASESSSHTDSPSASIFEKVPSAAQPLPSITPMRRGRPTRTHPDFSPTSNESAPSTPPTASRSGYDPFDPAHVKVFGDVHPQSSPLNNANSTFGFDSQFNPGHASQPSPMQRSSSANNVGQDDSAADDDSLYSIHLEPQTLDGISIPPDHSSPSSRPGSRPSSRPTSRPSSSFGQPIATHPSSGSPSPAKSPSTHPSSFTKPRSTSATSSPRLPASSPVIHTPTSTATPLSGHDPKPSPTGNRPRTSSVTNAIPQTSSTRSIREFMERKAAANASSDSASDSLQPHGASPSQPSRPTPVSVSQPTDRPQAQAPFRPKPPPKPARFRSNPTSQDTPKSPPLSTTRPRSPSITEFENKFPTLEELSQHLP